MRVADSAIELVIASNNKDKVREIAAALNGGFRVLSLADVGLGGFSIEETGATFEENALIKARTVRQTLTRPAPGGARPPASAGGERAVNDRLSGDVLAHTGAIVAADDSGLCVDALGGAPGVYSARYAGEAATDADRIAKLLGALSETPDKKGRAARFCCVIAIIFPDGTERLVQGVCEGEIARAPSGSNGFGYDPVFVLPDPGRTMAELTREEKNRVSHRGKAVRSMAAEIRNYTYDHSPHDVQT
ncbi:MAG: non-canonical purine NTP pyrophosphatase [Clostridiales bacterium]|jgi:XTP/dITP diphosphohydrolase|nr:non-canonical purine NTP pyrophosphatase [Clostridiales bacterium]